MVAVAQSVEHLVVVQAVAGSSPVSHPKEEDHTSTLTELNQNPSRATRLADHGEVIVMRRGHPAYRITKIENSGDPLDELVATGLA